VSPGKFRGHAADQDRVEKRNSKLGALVLLNSGAGLELAIQRLECDGEDISKCVAPDPAAEET
jgi:hypothetical protein